MFYVLGWVLYGLLVGSLSRMIHPGEEKPGCLYTIGIGVAGSVIGGVVNFIIGGGHSFSPAGVVMGVVGGVVFLAGLNYYNKNNPNNP